MCLTPVHKNALVAKKDVFCKKCLFKYRIKIRLLSLIGEYVFKKHIVLVLMNLEIFVKAFIVILNTILFYLVNQCIHALFLKELNII